MKKHILFVDDETHTQLSISLILKQAGYKVTTVGSGAEALQLLSQKQHPFDILLTDIKMPDITGLELMNLLNKHGITIPTVAITGFGNKDIVIQLMRCGCRDYLEKPFSANDLLACLENVFRTCDAEQLRQTDTRKANDKELKLAQEIETYKLNLEKLKSQIDSAVHVYHELIHLSPNNYAIPISWKILPLMELGGDFFGIEHNDDTYDILVADVAGHDMGSSFHTILIKAFFQENANKRNDGATLFHLINKQLVESGKNERMITSVFLRIDLKCMTAEIITAGHPPAIYQKKTSNQFQIISTGAPVLGICDNVEFSPEQFPIAPGDRFFLYTDGVIGVTQLHPTTGHLKKLTVSGLESLLKNRQQDALERVISSVWDDLLDYCDQKPCDDMLLMGIEIPKR